MTFIFYKWESPFIVINRQIHQKFRQTITSARYGGPVEATKRILAQLPISAQSYSSSPYLDQALFSYDDHRVSTMERPKACGEIPIRYLYAVICLKSLNNDLM